jgi:hypothetical protein
VNLGSEARCFIFCPVSLLSFTLADHINQRADASEVGREMLARYQDLPVLSLEVCPGEAYVAPTEMIIHDGSTAGTKTNDLTFTILGRIYAPDSRQG